TGLIAMIGKAERGPGAIEAIKDNQSAYLMAVGGAAYLVAKAIKNAQVVGFADLGMEAIYEFDVVDMPVTVAVDAGGTSVHITGGRTTIHRLLALAAAGAGLAAPGAASAALVSYDDFALTYIAPARWYGEEGKQYGGIRTENQRLIVSGQLRIQGKGWSDNYS